MEALDQYLNVATAENRGVTLVTSDGQRTLVPIQSGQGYVTVTTTLAHLVALSLADTLTTGLTVSSTSSINFLPGIQDIPFDCISPDVFMFVGCPSVRLG